MIKQLIKKFTLRTGRLQSVFIAYAKPSGEEYIEFLRKHSGIFHIGGDCHINVDVKILNPEYTKIGNNVCLSSCTLIGHDASIMVLNRAFDKRLDSVGKIVIHDHVFIGMGAIVMPNVTIGERCVVAAGAVVTKDIPANSVVAGVPAKIIGKTDELVKKLEQETELLPWKSLIQAREGAYDPELEPQLIKMRQSHFFKGE